MGSSQKPVVVQALAPSQHPGWTRTGPKDNSVPSTRWENVLQGKATWSNVWKANFHHFWWFMVSYPVQPTSGAKQRHHPVPTLSPESRTGILLHLLNGPWSQMLSDSRHGHQPHPGPPQAKDHQGPQSHAPHLSASGTGPQQTAAVPSEITSAWLPPDTMIVSGKSHADVIVLTLPAG